MLHRCVANSSVVDLELFLHNFQLSGTQEHGDHGRIAADSTEGNNINHLMCTSQFMKVHHAQVKI